MSQKLFSTFAIETDVILSGCSRLGIIDMMLELHKSKDMIFETHKNFSLSFSISSNSRSQKVPSHMSAICKVAFDQQVNVL